LTAAAASDCLSSMPYAPVRGQEIYFEDSGGPGLPLLLAHGFLMDHSMFDPQVRALAPGVRVIAWDARGFGQTRWDKKPFTYWDLAEDAMALLDHLGIDRAVLGGMSQGGFLSMRAALRYPDRVRALVLISSQAGIDDAETLARYGGMLEGWVAMGAVDPLVEAVAGIILGGKENWEPWVTRMRALPKEGVREPGACLIGREDITARLGEIRCPAIVFHGTADAAIPVARGELLARSLPGCKGFVCIEGAAHASNVSHPDAVSGPLVEFMSSIAKAG
jgi:3-oxoadipate enol-lactonase